MLWKKAKRIALFLLVSYGIMNFKIYYIDSSSHLIPEINSSQLELHNKHTIPKRNLSNRLKLRIKSLLRNHLTDTKPTKPSVSLAALNSKYVTQPRQNHTINAPLQLSINASSNAACPIFQIHRRGKIHDFNESRCIPHTSSSLGCLYARKKFVYDEKRTCEGEKQFIICQYYQGNFNCSLEACREIENKYNEIFIHLFNVTSGHVTVVDISRTNEELETKVKQFAIKTVRKGFNFMFLSCSDATDQTQFILLDQNVDQFAREDTDKLKKQTTNNDKKLNINLVLLDSVSRSHFYRSLIQTINAFNDINTENEEIAEVLDFEMFQALHGHSAENNHALFSGDVFPEHFTDLELEYQSTGLKKFVGFIQSNGYNLLYQDDMCWEGFWGLRTELGGSADWKDLYEKIELLRIYDTGLTFSNCKIFEDLYDKKHVFNLFEEENVCYNGRQHNAYFLKYILRAHTDYDSAKNLFSYANLNVAHDSGGVRIQAIDKDLAKFVKEMSQMENTMTIILSDHGNTYTDYVSLEMEGRYEMYHPSLFMILPKGVKKYIGDSMMTNLRLNQKRLVTMIDIHNTVYSLVNSNHLKKGLLQLISTNRDCHDIPLRLPNLCMCEGWQSLLQNTTALAAHVEFAVGMLNNIIVKYSANTCKRLVPLMFQNVLQRNDGEFARITFDIHTEAGQNSGNGVDKFSVEVALKRSESLKSLNMILIGKERLSKIGSYKACTDAVETFRLCVCDAQSHKYSNETKHSNPLRALLDKRTSRQYTLFHKEKNKVNERAKTLIKNKLIILIRTYYERQTEDVEEESKDIPIVVTFEGINLSFETAYRITIKFSDLGNMKPVSNNSCSSTIKPGIFLYLCTITRIFEWEASYTTQYYYEEL